MLIRQSIKSNQLITNKVTTSSSHRLFGESDAVSEADGAGAEALAVGPLAGDAGRVPVEVGPVVVGRLRVLPHFERDVLGHHRRRRYIGR